MYSKYELKDLLEFIIYYNYDNKYSNFNITAIYEELINRYKQETGVTLKLNDKNKKFIYEWLRRKVGYDLLNIMLEQSVDYLTGNYQNKHSYFVLDNLQSISDVIKLQIKDSLLDINKQMVSASLVDKNKTEELFVSFLKHIDPSLEWLNLYYDAKSNGNIIYLDELTDKEKQETLKKFEMDEFKDINGCVHINGNQYIWLTRVNTTEDFISLLHEFIHYIVDLKNNSRDIPHVLVEFPSIFYELYSHKFLLEQGFSEEELNLLKAKRMNNSLYGASSITEIFEVIKMFLKNGEITERMLVDKHNKSINNAKTILLDNTVNKVFKKNNENLTHYQIETKVWENITEKIIKKLKYAYVWYPYIVGTYFSNRALENLDAYSLIKMKYITENFSLLNVYDALTILNIDLDKLGIIPISYGKGLK